MPPSYAPTCFAYSIARFLRISNSEKIRSIIEISSDNIRFKNFCTLGIFVTTILPDRSSISAIPICFSMMLGVMPSTFPAAISINKLDTAPVEYWSSRFMSSSNMELPAAASRCPFVSAPIWLMRRAIEETKRACDFILVVTVLKRGGCFWLVRCVLPSPWIALSARQPGWIK